MTISGEDTISAIDETLTRLVEQDFTQFQAALEIRAEVNLVTGLAIAFGQNRQSQIASIITDLANSGIDRLNALVAANQDTPAFAEVVPAVKEAIEVYKNVFADGAGAPESSGILAARLAVDRVLSPALDDINFNLIIGNDEAKETNRESISRLLEQEVEGMRRNAALDAAAKHFFALLLEAAAAHSTAEVALKQQELLAQAGVVRTLKAGTDFEEQANLESLLGLSDPDTGIAAQRTAVFAAQAAALQSSQEATRSVGAIAEETSRISTLALNKIGAVAEALTGNVDTAKSQLSQISYVALGLLVIAPVLLWAFVTRPIGRVTAVTERLASGDLSEIKGLRANQGELGRLASALHVFRDGALRNIEMQEAERKRERAALEEERQAEQKRLADERRLAAEQAEREEAERAREAKRAAEEEERRRFNETQRKARMDEQARIVSNLAEGLKSLAAGDLTCQINEDFPETYEALRLDFNAAIGKLAAIIYQLKDSSNTIEGNCQEIAASSDDLARRTEKNAATLVETVAAIGDLSASVSDSANGAGEASKTIQNVRDQAKLNNQVMTQAAPKTDPTSLWQVQNRDPALIPTQKHKL